MTLRKISISALGFCPDVRIDNICGRIRGRHQRIIESEEHIVAIIVSERYGGLYDLGLMQRITQVEPRLDLNRETFARLFDKTPDFIWNSHSKPEKIIPGISQADTKKT
jgi:hypothetical protein